MADSGERTTSFSHDPLVCNCMLLDYCLLDTLKRERNTLCSIYGLRSVCKQLKQSVKVFNRELTRTALLKPLKT